MNHVLILGASGELGAALALECMRFASTITLWGRDAGRLSQTAELCTQSGSARIRCRQVDLLDLDTALAAIEAEDRTEPVDLVIFASGQGDIGRPGEAFEHPELVSRLFQVNCVGPSMLAAALARQMAARRRGYIVFIGSAASFAALPFAASYAASKAALAHFADALRIAMRPYEVSVTLVSPGFIDTAAAHRVPGPKPFIMPPHHAAQAIVAAAMRRKAHLVMPWSFRLIPWVHAALPNALRDPLLRALALPQPRGS